VPEPELGLVPGLVPEPELVLVLVLVPEPGLGLVPGPGPHRQPSSRLTTMPAELTMFSFSSKNSLI